MNRTSATDLQALHHPAVRDLAWACFRPGMLDLPCSMSIPELDERRWSWLQALDHSPEPLLTCLAGQRSSRLGLYFERLWQFFLEQDPAYDLLAHNVPVRVGGRTLGEFDLLYFCHRRQRAVHLELAMKFYLGDDRHRHTASANDSWLGPNSRDRLDLKLERLLQHQVSLGRSDAGREALAELGVQAPLEEVHIAGRLYRHITSSMPAPPGYRDSQALQRWCRAAESGPFLERSTGLTWRALDRGQWLAPVRQAELAMSLPQPGETLPRPLQLAGFTKEGLEAQRLFIVPDHWPESPAD